MGHSPQWGMYIVWYFFVGGIAAGAYFTAALVDLFGGTDDRPAVRAGYFVALPLVLVCPILLTLDLGVPARTFNMFLSFDVRSPMSVGSWALLGFGIFAVASVLLVVFEDRLGWAPRVRRGIGLVGSLFGFFIASYTGVLLAATNRPIWAGSTLLGAVFLMSAASTGVAAIALPLLARRALRARLWARLGALEQVVLVLEVVALAAFLGLLGGAAGPIVRGEFAWLFWVLLVVLGLAIPFGLHLGMTFAPGRVRPSAGAIAVSAVLLLVGGFVLRYVVLMAGQT